MERSGGGGGRRAAAPSGVFFRERQEDRPRAAQKAHANIGRFEGDGGLLPPGGPHAKVAGRPRGQEARRHRAPSHPARASPRNPPPPRARAPPPPLPRVRCPSLLLPSCPRSPPAEASGARSFPSDSFLHRSLECVGVWLCGCLDMWVSGCVDCGGKRSYGGAGGGISDCCPLGPCWAGPAVGGARTTPCAARSSQLGTGSAPTWWLGSPTAR